MMDEYLKMRRATIALTAPSMSELPLGVDMSGDVEGNEEEGNGDVGAGSIVNPGNDNEGQHVS